MPTLYESREMTHNPPPLNTHSHNTHTQTYGHANFVLSPAFIHWPWRICAGSLTHAYLHWTHTHSPTQRALSKGYCVWVCERVSVCTSVHMSACVKVTSSEADHLFMACTDCWIDNENTWTCRQTPLLAGQPAWKLKKIKLNLINEHRCQLHPKATPQSYSEPTITHSSRTLHGLFLARQREEKGQNLLLGFKHIFHPDYCCSILFKKKEKKNPFPPLPLAARYLWKSNLAPSFLSSLHNSCIFTHSKWLVICGYRFQGEW